MNRKILAGLAILLGAYLGGIAPVFMKYALRDFSPIFIVWARFLISLCFLLPLVLWQGKGEFKKNLKQPLLVSLIFMINPVLFVYGIRYTTSVASQLMFLLSPILIILLSKFRENQNPRWYQTLGMILGTLGVLVLLLNRSEALTNSLGTAKGNLIILVGALCWGAYLYASKQITTKFTPVFLVTLNSLAIAVLLLPIIGLSLYRGDLTNGTLSWQGVGSIFALGFFNSTLCFLFYQWGLKYVSAFVTSSATYISPFAAASLAIPLMGETISWPLVLSAVLIFASSFFIMLYPQLSNRTSSNVSNTTKK